MCGIIGYTGDKNALNILISGLKRLEYRGYDSAGIAICNHQLSVYRKKGKVTDLEKAINGFKLEGTTGIGHTRWATHGEPNDVNAHPHTSMKGTFAIVHNGIIENYAVLKKELTENGYTFNSETDTEVLVNLIEYTYYRDNCLNAESAIRQALSKVTGTYGIVVLCMEEEGKLFAARKGSPLIVGMGKGEYFIASDATAMIGHTDQVIYLNDSDLAVIMKNRHSVTNMENNQHSATVQKLEMTIGKVDKGDFDHFMLKEISEQPDILKNMLRDRLHPEHSEIRLNELKNVFPLIRDARRIILIGCGTSWHAGLIGEYLIEELAGIAVEVEYASEFRYRKPVISGNDVVIAISQSGETADTLAAVKLAKDAGALTIGICNVAGSTLTRETATTIFTRAGIEIGVASTKAFTAQVTLLTCLALKLACSRETISVETYSDLTRQLATIPDKMRKILNNQCQIKKIAVKYSDSVNALFIGRGVLFPVALEGALKMKEISYIHAEGYAAGEMKHGPIALVDENLPVIVVVPKDAHYEKLISNIREVKARKGNIISVVTEGDQQMKELADDMMEISEIHPVLAPLLAVIPLQLLAYYTAVKKGCNVDQPRNLAKSVTVE